MCYIVVYVLENIFTEHMASRSQRINIKWGIGDGSVWLAKIDWGSLGESSVAVRILRRRECPIGWCFSAITQMRKAMPSYKQLTHTWQKPTREVKATSWRSWLNLLSKSVLLLAEFPASLSHCVSIYRLDKQ